MATSEQNGLMIYKDESGNKYILYPITKAELVQGLDEALAGKADASALEEKAPAVHEHSAADITSGALPVSRGGTGQTTALAAAKAFGRGSATCGTSAATVAKTVTLSGFVLVTGSVVGVKFTYGNTAVAPTLNVNSTGAKPIYNSMTNEAISSTDILAGQTCFFVYNGTQWMLTNPKVAAGLEGMANEYMWEKVRQSVEVTSTDWSITVQAMAMSAYFTTSDTYEIVDGKFVLTNATQVQVTSANQTQLQSLLKKYFFHATAAGGFVTESDVMYEVTADTTFTNTTIAAAAAMVVDNLSVLSAVEETVGYVNSSDPSAYPANDGFSYYSRGQVGRAAMSETGSYKGTGTYGSANPCTLTFDFPPSMIVITAKGGSSSPLTLVRGGNTSTVQTTWTENSVSWYTTSSSVSAQMNSVGVTYCYIAIG